MRSLTAVARARTSVGSLIDTPGMTSTALARTIFSPDVYTYTPRTSPIYTDDMAEACDPIYNLGRSWGFTRFGVGEHAVSYDPATATDAQLISAWQSTFDYLEALDGLVYYCYFGNWQGGAQDHLTPAVTPMFANFALEHKP